MMIKSFWILVVIYFGLFFLNSLQTPLMADDFFYSQWSREGLWQSLTHYYLGWGGRVWAHFWASTLASSGPLMFAILNTLVLLAAVSCSLRLVSGNFFYKADQGGPLLIALFLFLITCFAKARYQTHYMIAGAANYLWMILCLLLFLSFAVSWFTHAGPDQRFSLRSPAVWLLAVLTGASNENVGLGLVALYFFFVLSRYLKKQKIVYLPEIVTMLFLVAGSAFLLAAPGNYVRRAVIYPQGLPSLPERLKWWIESALIFIGRPDGILLILVTGVGLYWLRRFRHAPIKSLLRNDWKSVGFFALAFFLALVFLGNDGNFYGRKSLNVSWIFTIGITYLLWNSGLASFLQRNKSDIVVVLANIFILLSSGRLLYEASAIIKYKQAMVAREQQILALHRQGQTEISVPILQNPYDNEDLSPESSHWINQSYSRYLGVGSLRGLEKR